VPPAPPSDNPPAKPFVIIPQRLDETPSGSFRPGAQVAVTPALRTSGLLLALPSEELRSLLLVLTFVTANGHVHPSALELAQALRQPVGRTRARMRRLERFLWQGRPLLYELRRESGLHAYAPSPRILGTKQAAPIPATAAPGDRAAAREAVIARSRAAYARPRDEVEREIAERNGWPWPFRSIAEAHEELRRKALDRANAPPGQPSSPTDLSPPLSLIPMPTNLTQDPTYELRQTLLLLGVPADQADTLLAHFDADRIRRQIEWLPFRRAKSPARLLVASIYNDYEPPAVLHERPVPQDMAGESAVQDLPDDLPLP